MQKSRTIFDSKLSYLQGYGYDSKIEKINSNGKLGYQLNIDFVISDDIDNPQILTSKTVGKLEKIVDTVNTSCIYIDKKILNKIYIVCPNGKEVDYTYVESADNSELLQAMQSVVIETSDSTSQIVKKLANNILKTQV